MHNRVQLDVHMQGIGQYWISTQAHLESSVCLGVEDNKETAHRGKRGLPDLSEPELCIAYLATVVPSMATSVV